ncbi:hypothetical protein ACVGX7_05730, partial [Enterobacter hormaechei]
VMMTAVSFIIGVLALIVAPRGGVQCRPKKRTKVFIRHLVGAPGGIFIKPARLVVFQRAH